MSIRWRLNGDLVCAAMHPSEDGDSYIDDRLHYQLSVISRAIVADVNHDHNGNWVWVHSDGGFIRGVKEDQERRGALSLPSNELI